MQHPEANLELLFSVYSIIFLQKLLFETGCQFSRLMAIRFYVASL